MRYLRILALLLPLTACDKKDPEQAFLDKIRDDYKAMWKTEPMRVCLLAREDANRFDFTEEYNAVCNRFGLRAR